MRKGFWLSLITVLFIIIYPSLSIANTHFTQIRQLLAAHKTQEAYRLANQIARQQEGNPDFDLLFGSVAIEAGHPDKAIFALDRVLMKQPNNTYAKEKLARAYYVLDQNNARRKPSHNLALGIFSGYDSNINSATANTSINIPYIVGPLLLSGNNINIHDGFFNFAGDWQGSYPISSRHPAGLFWDVNTNYRDNIHNSFFNLNTFNTMGGFMMQHGSYTLRVPLRTQLMYLNGNPLRRALTMGISVDRPIVNDHHVGMVFIEKGSQTYPTVEILTGLTHLGGLGWLYLPDSKTQAATRVYYGVNRAKLINPASHSGLASHYYGAQISLSREILDRHTVSLDLGEQYSAFNDNDPLYIILRKDNFFNLGLSYEWKYNNNFAIVGNYTHFKNNSDLPLFQYDRNVAQIGLKYNT